MSLRHSDPLSTDGAMDSGKAEVVSLAVLDDKEQGEEEYYPEGGFRGWAAVVGAYVLDPAEREV